jgi:hypothetical protein
MDLFHHDLGFEGRTVQPLLHGLAELGVDGLGRDSIPSLDASVIDHESLLDLKSRGFSGAFQSPFGLLPRPRETYKQYCTTIGASGRSPGLQLLLLELWVCVSFIFTLSPNALFVLGEKASVREPDQCPFAQVTIHADKA